MERTTGKPGRGAGAGSARGDKLPVRDDWMLAVDIREVEQDYRVPVELPGVAAEDIQWKVENGVLLLTGERRRHGSTGHHRPRRCPGCYRHFARSISLPFDARSECVDATFQDGVVEIRFAKHATTGSGAVDKTTA